MTSCRSGHCVPARRACDHGQCLPLGVPTVLDRCLQAHVKNPLELCWEARFYRVLRSRLHGGLNVQQCAIRGMTPRSFGRGTPRSTEASVWPAARMRLRLPPLFACVISIGFRHVQTTSTLTPHPKRTTAADSLRAAWAISSLTSREGYPRSPTGRAREGRRADSGPARTSHNCNYYYI
jgi:hypothetical protein